MKKPPRKPRYLLWVFALLIVGAAVYAGFWFFGREQTPAGPIAVIVNGERIAQADVDETLEKLLARYRNLYRQEGRNFDEETQGAAGAYLKLQIRYDAASLLMRDALVRQEAHRRGISASKSELDPAFQERYQNFLRDNGIKDEQTLLQIFEDPQRKKLAQSLLGLREDSVEDFKANVRRNVLQEILENKLKASVIGQITPSPLELVTYVEKQKEQYRDQVLPPIPPTEDELLSYFQEHRKDFGDQSFEKVKRLIETRLVEQKQELRFRQWLEEARTRSSFPADPEITRQVQQAYVTEQLHNRFEAWLARELAQARIEFSDPLLAAYHWERLMESAQTTQEKEKYLDRAIAGYEAIRSKKLSSDPNVEYYLSRLYNQKVKLAQQQREQLKNTSGSQETLRRIEGQIGDYRRKVSEFFLSSGLDEARVYQTALATDPDNPLFYYLYARVLLNQENGWFQAFRMLEQAVKLDPRYAEAYVLLGDLQMSREHYLEARQQYRQAWQLLRDDASRLPDRIRVQKKLIEADLKLAEQFKSLPERESERREAILEAQQLLEELFELVKETDPTYTEILADAGDLAVLQGQFDEAIQSYREALERAQIPAVEIKLGQVYLLSKKLSEAEHLFQGYIAAHPKAKEGYLGVGDVYRARNEKAKALENYRRALALVLSSTEEEASYFERREVALRILELAPDDLDTRLALGQIYLENHVFEGAINEYQQVLTMKPKTLEAYMGLAKAYQGQLRWDLAKANLRKALELHPTPELEIQIYKALLEIERKLAGVGKPLKEEGQSALYRLAELFIQQKDWDQAQKPLQELREKYPNYRSKDVSRLWEQVENQDHGD